MDGVHGLGVGSWRGSLRFVCVFCKGWVSVMHGDSESKE